MDHSRAVYVTDLSVCTPAAALSVRRQKYHWQTISYETEEFSGVMLSTGPETEAPEVTLPLGVTGWHAVFIGLWGTEGQDVWGEGTNQDTVKVRLSDNPCFTRIAREEPDYFTFDERFWIYADLTGRDIVFGQQMSGWPARAYPAYVKLVPLSDAEVEAIQSERQRENTKTLIGIACEGDDYLGNLRPTTREEIWELVEPYRDTDFRQLFWCVGSGGDICTYPTRIGALQNVEREDRSRPFDRVKGEALSILLGKGIDPLEEAVSHAHKLGLEMNAQLRMGAFQAAPPLEGTYTGPVWGRHPEWHCIDIDGREIARMSYAFEGMQDYVLSLLLELAGYDVDGVCMTWVRGAPYVLYEKPLVEGFKAKTGKDPRDLPEDNEEYLRYRAGFMTAFARKVRRAMDERGRQRGRKVELLTHVLNDEDANLFYGFDVETWVREGLIDTLIPYPWREKDIDVAYFAGITGGTSVSLRPEIMPRSMPPEQFRRHALDFYDKGAEGFCFWDTEGRHLRRAEWSMMQRLGHRNDLAGWNDGEGEFFRSIKLRSLGGYVMDKYPPLWAY